MANAIFDTNEIELDQNTARRREEIQECFHAALANLGRKGWHPAEAAMAIADVAEDFIMDIAKRGSIRH